MDHPCNQILPTHLARFLLFNDASRDATISPKLDVASNGPAISKRRTSSPASCDSCWWAKKLHDKEALGPQNESWYKCSVTMCYLQLLEYVGLLIDCMIFLKRCPDTSVLCQSKTSWSNAPPLLPKCSPHPTTFESPCSGHFYAGWMTGWRNLFRWLNLSLRNLNISWLLNQQGIECEV